MTRDEERLVQALEQSNTLLTQAMPLVDAELGLEIAVHIEASEKLIAQVRQ